MPFADRGETRAAGAVRSGRAGCFLALMKPRVMSLAIFTALVAMALAPGALSPVRTLLAILAIAAGAGAAGALNMWYDAGIDARMSRTSSRPVPAGQVTPAEALGFGLILTVASVAALAAAANPLAAALLAATIAFYGVVYTMWLKHATPQNIVIGGAAGALPPVIGWTAISGSLDWQPWILFLIVFLWTPPHFWALALLKHRDYAAAGIPMLPVVAGEAATRRQIVLYSALLLPAGIAPWGAGLAGAGYGIVALVLGAEMLRRAWGLLRAPADDARPRARGLFLFSIVYLYALFAALLADAALRFAVAALGG